MIRSIESMEIRWVHDPDGDWKQRPCRGCPDFCDEEYEDAVGVDKHACPGDSWRRQVALWHVTAQWQDLLARPVSVVGIGVTMTGAIADVGRRGREYEAAAAANLIQLSMVDG